MTLKFAVNAAICGKCRKLSKIGRKSELQDLKASHYRNTLPYQELAKHNYVQVGRCSKSGNVSYSVTVCCHVVVNAWKKFEILIFANIRQYFYQNIGKLLFHILIQDEAC